MRGLISFRLRSRPAVSWGWRSIIWGKSLLLKDLKWRVGNGTNVDTFGINGYWELKILVWGHHMVSFFTNLWVVNLMDHQKGNPRAGCAGCSAPSECFGRPRFEDGSEPSKRGRLGWCLVRPGRAPGHSKPPGFQKGGGECLWFLCSFWKMWRRKFQCCT